MSKPLIIIDEIYDYPTTGESNYGEDATGWAEAATSVLGQVSGPGDIQTTEVVLSGTDTGTHITGNITGMVLDTAYVQSTEISGFITRTFDNGDPDKVEGFNLIGAYNGTSLNFSVTMTGDDTDLEIGATGGQFTFTYLKIANTDSVTMKFFGKSIVNENYFA